MGGGGDTRLFLSGQTPWRGSKVTWGAELGSPVCEEPSTAWHWCPRPGAGLPAAALSLRMLVWGLGKARPKWFPQTRHPERGTTRLAVRVTGETPGNSS